MTREESDIRLEILKNFRATFPGGHIDRIWCGQAVTNHGTRVIGAEPGTPDLIGYLPDGRFLGIEVKIPGAKPRAHEPKQNAFREKASLAGGVCIKVTSWEEAHKAIREAMRLPFE